MGNFNPSESHDDMMIMCKRKNFLYENNTFDMLHQTGFFINGMGNTLHPCFYDVSDQK